MLFKYFLLQVLVTLTTVTALPVLDIVDNSLEARDDEAANQYGRNSHCGSQATLKHGRCVCYKEGQVFNPATKECDCPYGQEWNRKDGCTEPQIKRRATAYNPPTTKRPVPEYKPPTTKRPVPEYKPPTTKRPVPEYKPPTTKRP
ncbi:hypothetical protein ACHAPD_006839, partial [Fusarium lateritium]